MDVFPGEVLLPWLGWCGEALLRGISTADEASHALAELGNQCCCSTLQSLGFWCRTMGASCIHHLHRPLRVVAPHQLLQRSRGRPPSSGHAPETKELEPAGAVSRGVTAVSRFVPWQCLLQPLRHSRLARRDGIVDQFPSQHHACVLPGRSERCVSPFRCVNARRVRLLARRS